MIPVRGSLPPPPWYGPKTHVLQHSGTKPDICSVFCMVGGWRRFLQPTFGKRVIRRSYATLLEPKQCFGFDIMEQCHRTPFYVKLSYNSKSSITLPSAKGLQPPEPIWYLSISYTCLTFPYMILFDLVSVSDL